MRPELPSTAFRTGLRFAASLGIGLTSVLSPIEERPKPVQADQPLTLLHGDGAKDRLNIMLLPYNSTTTQMLQEVAEDIFLIPPTDEFRNRVNVYTTNPTEDLKCDQNGICDWGAIDREINRFIASYGIIPHETLVVIKSNNEHDGNGRARLLAPRSNPPDIYSTSTIVRPITSGRDPNIRKMDVRLLAEELWGHAFAGFDHEGGDLMDGRCSGDACNNFNDQHAQFLRRHFALSPANYLTPKNEIKIGGINSLSTQSFVQSQDMSLAAVVFTPIGSTQLYSEIVPAANIFTGIPDGPGISDYIGSPEHIHAWSEIGKRIPAPKMGEGSYILLPDMTYTWKVRSSGLAVPLLKDDQRWTQVEGWPGIFFPNTPAEIKIKTPKRFSDGITVLLPQNGAVVDSPRPTLSWANQDLDVFYYEIQSSKDGSFNTDPDTATAAVYWNLIHGGETKPLNSWQTPLLEPNTEYYWRVRPRVQGDGTPVEWSRTFTFQTASTEGVKGVSGVMADADYGYGIIGPSAEDLERWGNQMK